MTSSKHLQIVNEPLLTGSEVAITNLIEVYELFTQLEILCRKKKYPFLSAVQVGLPHNLFVFLEGKQYRKIMNASYEPKGERTLRGFVRYVNVEKDRPRHFMVNFYNEVDAKYSEIGNDGKVVEKKESGPLLWLQLNADIVYGRCPTQGIEYLVGL